MFLVELLNTLQFQFQQRVILKILETLLKICLFHFEKLYIKISGFDLKTVKKLISLKGLFVKL